MRAGTVVYDKYDNDPLVGNQKKVGGTPYYEGKAGKVKENIVAWAKGALLTVAQICPGRHHLFGLFTYRTP